jgi:hypothetical protein
MEALENKFRSISSKIVDSSKSKFPGYLEEVKALKKQQTSIIVKLGYNPDKS